ncbi:MAG: MFS transporter [Defluviitaleaceae bacterium]|nr:MFS transporter [Defluviitaleaceae bacterium]
MPKRKTIFAIIKWAVLLVAAVFFFSNISAFKLNPFEGTELSWVFSSKVDPHGNIYIADYGSERIIKVGQDGRMDFLLEIGDGFSFVRVIAADGGPIFYILDVVWNPDGMSVGMERIVAMCSQTGRVLYVAYELVHEQRQSLVHIGAIAILDGVVWFVQSSEYGIALRYIDESNAASTYHFHPFTNANLVLQHFSITTEGIYILDRAGTVMSLQDGQLTTIYTATSGNDIESFSLPYHIAKSGVLYFTDVGQRSVGFFDAQGQRHDLIAPDLSLDLEDRIIYFSVYASGERVVFTTYATVYVASPYGEILDAIHYIQPGQAMVTLRLFLLASLLIMVAAAVFAAIRAIKNLQKITLTQKQQITIVIVSVSLLISVAVVPGIMDSYEARARGEIVNRLSSLVLLSQSIIDTEAFQNIANPQYYNSEYYLRLMQSLRDLVDVSHEWNESIYIVAIRFQGNHLYDIAFLDGNMGAFNTFGGLLEGSDLEMVIESGGQFVVNDNIVDRSGFYMAVVGPVYGEDGVIIGGVEIGINLTAFNESISNEVWQLFVNIAIIIALLVFIMIEGMDAILTYAARAKTRAEFNEVLLPIPFIRILAFVICVAFNLTTGFLPIYAGQFYAELWGMSPEVVSALPLTINLVMLALAASLGGLIKRGIGFKATFVLGVALSVAGDSINALAGDFNTFVLGMSLSGLGAGLVFSILSIYIASLEDAKHKAEGFSLFNSASFAGMNVGILVGASLAVILGQAPIFFGSAIGWLLSLAFFAFLINRKVISKPPKLNKVKMDKAQRRQAGFGSFISSRRVLAFLILFLTYVTLNGFLFYFVPVFGAESGLLETEISLLFMLHATSLMFIGPAITKRLEARGTDHKSIIVISMLLSIVALAIVAYHPDILFIIAAVAILGCSNSIGFTYFPLFFSEMNRVKKYGADEAMSTYSAVDNLGGAFAPFAFAWAITIGLGAGFAVISAVAAGVLILCYILIFRRKRQKYAYLYAKGGTDFDD